MLAFVTGSTGLLGNNLVRALLHEGHRVRALARSKEKARRELGDTEARVVLGDMSDIAGFADALDGVDVVFHIAAYYADFGEITTDLALLTGARRPTTKMPFAGALAVAAIAETWSRVTGKASPISVEGVRLLHARLKATSAKAERELSVSFRPFSASLGDTVEWARTRFQRVGDPQVAVLSGSGH